MDPELGAELGNRRWAVIMLNPGVGGASSSQKMWQWSEGQEGGVVVGCIRC